MFGYGKNLGMEILTKIVINGLRQKRLEKEYTKD